MHHVSPLETQYILSEDFPDGMINNRLIWGDNVKCMVCHLMEPLAPFASQWMQKLYRKWLGLVIIMIGE
jgi:hypothetical protein